jgi:hypothetical protein
MKLSIPTTVFKAAQHCAAVKDVRYYLNGINLRLCNGSTGQVYSTDGHVLFVANFTIEYQESADIADCQSTFDLIVPLEAVKHASKSKNKLVVLESMDNGCYLLDGLMFAAIDGKYPDISRVIPDRAKFKPDNLPGQFNPELLVKCQKALRAWFNNKTGVYQLFQQGANDTALMQGPDNSGFCVVMPCRVESNDSPYSFTLLTV